MSRLIDECSHYLSRVLKRLLREVRVPLRGLDLGMPEEVLHHVQRDALVDREARKGVHEVAQPDIGEPGSATDARPR